MSIDAINSAKMRYNVEATSALSQKIDAVSAQAQNSPPVAGGGSAPSEDEEIVTKIIVNAEGERVMIFMQGDEVLRTLKLGGNETKLADPEMSTAEQQYVDNGISDIGLLLNVNS